MSGKSNWTWSFGQCNEGQQASSPSQVPCLSLKSSSICSVLSPLTPLCIHLSSLLFSLYHKKQEGKQRCSQKMLMGDTNPHENSASGTLTLEQGSRPHENLGRNFLNLQNLACQALRTPKHSYPQSPFKTGVSRKGRIGLTKACSWGPPAP